jgi:hypothetical protein
MSVFVKSELETFLLPEGETMDGPEARSLVVHTHPKHDALVVLRIVGEGNECAVSAWDLIEAARVAAKNTRGCGR